MQEGRAPPASTRSLEGRAPLAGAATPVLCWGLDHPLNFFFKLRQSCFLRAGLGSEYKERKGQRFPITDMPRQSGTFVTTMDLHRHVLVTKAHSSRQWSFLVWYLLWVYVTMPCGHHYGVTQRSVTALHALRAVPAPPSPCSPTSASTGPSTLSGSTLSRKGSHSRWVFQVGFFRLVTCIQVSSMSFQV